MGYRVASDGNQNTLGFLKKLLLGCGLSYSRIMFPEMDFELFHAVP